MLTITGISDHIKLLEGVHLNLMSEFELCMRAVFVPDGVYPPFFEVAPIAAIPDHFFLGAPVVIGYTHNMKFYSFSSTIIDKRHSQVVLTLPDKLTIVQRRNYIRALPSGAVPVTFSSQDKNYTAKLHDISQGGACLMAEEGLFNNEKISIQLPRHNEAGFIHLDGVVRQCSISVDGLFKCGIQFENLNMMDSAALTKYIAGLKRDMENGRKHGYGKTPSVPLLDKHVRYLMNE